MSIFQFGAGGGSSPVEYADAGNSPGQSYAPGETDPLTLTNVYYLGKGFSAVPGDTVIRFGAGVYLAIAAVYAAGGVLTSGYVQGVPAGPDVVFRAQSPCMALATDYCGAVGVSLIVASGDSEAWINARHTGGSNHNLSGELCVMRLS